MEIGTPECECCESSLARARADSVLRDGVLGDELSGDERRTLGILDHCQSGPRRVERPVDDTTAELGGLRRGLDHVVDTGEK